MQIWTPIGDKICYIADLLRNDGYIIYQRPQLRQINLGMAEDMTLEEIKEKYPLEIRCFQENPNTHRFPRGEVYIYIAFAKLIVTEYERLKTST